jgi:hypothetical protein
LIGQPAYELFFALVAVAGITAGYLWLAAGGGPPQPSGLVGHMLGVVGFLLMLCTEVLYSLRKRLPKFHTGRMSLWLQAHIVTGIVGPYLVLLHSGWRFQGLAGLLTLLTVIVVVSGLIGRYIYTAVPRSLDGAVLQIIDLEQRILSIEQELEKQNIDVRTKELAAATTVPRNGLLFILARPLLRWRAWRVLRRVARERGVGHRARAEVMKLLVERQGLQMQVQALDTTRWVLALWHALHVPLTGALFTLAFVHIFGALYYATFLK